MIKLSQILGLRVTTEDGRQLGHVFDLRVKREDGSWAVSGVVYGRRGVSERLGLEKGRQEEPLRTSEVIPWDDVLRLDEARLIVRDRER